MKRTGYLLALVTLIAPLSGCNKASVDPDHTTIETSALEASTPEREAARRKSCASNLKQVGLGMMIYSQKHNDMLPAFTTMDILQTALADQSLPSSLFVCPKSKRPYEANLFANSKSVISFANPSTTVLLYEADAAHDGGRNVLFADGHVKWFSESDWKNIKH